jgi:hypothetical protein
MYPKGPRDSIAPSQPKWDAALGLPKSLTAADYPRSKSVQRG